MTNEARAMIAPLTSRQIGLCVALGIALWFLAALLLRLVGLAGAFEGWSRALLFVAIVPGSVPVVLMFRAVVGLAGGQLPGAVAIGTAAAAMLDGLALSWWPALYGTRIDLIAGSGATILWGAGVLIFLAYAFDRPVPS
jgi:hypothetical protein